MNLRTNLEILQKFLIMEKLEAYKDIHRTMIAIKIQILDSLDYLDWFLPKIEKYNIQELWDTLKPTVKYVNDPKGTELLQTAETLYEKNFHRIRGAGDCDCFTILTTAACIVLNFPSKIVLVGRTYKEPVHIYNKIWDGNQYQTFDLTNKQPFVERFYPIKNEIFVDI